MRYTKCRHVFQEFFEYFLGGACLEGLDCHKIRCKVHKDDYVMMASVGRKIGSNVNPYRGSGFGGCGSHVELVSLICSIHVQLTWHALFDSLGYSSFHGGEVVSIPEG